MFKLRSILYDFALIGCIFYVSQLIIGVALFTDNPLAFWKSSVGHVENFTSQIPSDLRVIANGLGLGLILLLLMGTGLCLDMIASTGSVLFEPYWFAKHIKRNFTWWKPFAARYNEYVGDTQAMLKYLERMPRRESVSETFRELDDFAICKDVLNSTSVSAREKLLYRCVMVLLLPTCVLILFVRQLRKLPGGFRDQSLYFGQSRRIQDFLLSFATSFADATKGDLLTDEIRVWRLNRAISLVLLICCVELMARCVIVSLGRIHPFANDVSGKALLVMVFVIAAEIGGLAVLGGGVQSVLNCAYQRLCAMLFAATYVGYIKLKKDDKGVEGDASPAEKQAQAPSSQPAIVRALPSTKRLRIYKVVGIIGVIVALPASVTFLVLDHSRSSLLRGSTQALSECAAIYSGMSANASSLDREESNDRVKSLLAEADICMSRTKDFDRRWGVLESASSVFLLAGAWMSISGLGLNYVFSERIRKKVGRA